MRELVFILTNSPNIDVIVPYEGLDYMHRSALHLSSMVRDNSSVAERLIPGQFSRLTLDCNIPDAHLFDIRAKDYIGLNILGIAVVSGTETTVQPPFGTQDAYHLGLEIPEPDKTILVREPLTVASYEGDIIVAD